MFVCFLIFSTLGWEITLQWVPFYSGIRGSEVTDAAAKMALNLVNTTPLPLPLFSAKHLISHSCHSFWNNTHRDSLRTTCKGQYRTDSSPHPWIRQRSRILDVAIARRLPGHTTVTPHLLIAYAWPLTHSVALVQDCSRDH